MASKVSPFTLLLTPLIILMRRSFRLIVTPYKTMRSISLETEYGELYWIGLLVIGYFLIVGVNKLFTFVILFAVTVVLMYAAALSWRKVIKISTLLSTFGYGLLPTVVWFYLSLGLYYLIPPPRTPSIQGKVFSVIYVSFSLSLLLWKLILTYLAIRFSLRLGFYGTIFTLFFYIICILILSYFGYSLGLSKVPFI